MVSLTCIQSQRKYYDDNLEKLAKEHGGQYIFILNGKTPKFFRNKYSLELEVDKYSNLFGPTIFTQKIPKYKEAKKIVEEKKKYPLGKPEFLQERCIPHKPRDNIKFGANI